MKKVYSTNDSSEVELVKNLLEKEGIECAIETSSGMAPLTDCFPELWVLNDGDYPRAEEVVKNWMSPQVPDKEAWICPKCGEKIEGQFSTCWRCAKADEPAETGAASHPV